MKILAFLAFVALLLPAELYAKTRYGIYKKKEGMVTIVPVGDSGSTDVTVSIWGNYAADCNLSGTTKEKGSKFSISHNGCSLLIDIRDDTVYIDDKECSSYCSQLLSGFKGRYMRLK